MLSFPFVIVLTLNIERLAIARKFDQLLVDPDDGFWAKITAFVGQPWVVIVAALFVGFTIGIWADLVGRAIFSRHRPTKNNRRAQVGQDMTEHAQRIEYELDSWIEPQSQISRRLAVDVHLVLRNASDLGLAVPPQLVSPREMIDYLYTVGGLLTAGRFDEARAAAEEVASRRHPEVF